MADAENQSNSELMIWKVRFGVQCISEAKPTWIFCFKNHGAIQFIVELINKEELLGVTMKEGSISDPEIGVGGNTAL